jgi:hypothetical protein
MFLYNKDLINVSSHLCLILAKLDVQVEAQTIASDFASFTVILEWAAL